MPEADGDPGIQVSVVDTKVFDFLRIAEKALKAAEAAESAPSETVEDTVRKGLEEFLLVLDKITLDHGGRLYLAKDAAMKPDTFKAMYPRLDDFLEIRKRLDTKSLLSSSLARRLRIDNRGEAE